jgi:hypothetical protein
MNVIIEEIEIFDNNIRWSGISIKTNKRSKNIICKISNINHCCEHFGIHIIFKLHNNIRPGKLEDFIGSTYKSVDIKKVEEDDVEFLTIVEINIHTDVGTIVVQLYNEHYGYYKHEFFTQTEQGRCLDSL